MYELKLDADNKRLDVTLRGFWDAATMTRFEHAMPQALRDLKRWGEPTRCLVDASEFPVQSGDIAERHQRLIGKLGELAAQRIAMVLPGHLVKLQATRAAGDVRHAMFTSRAAATAWLHEEDV